MTNLEEKNKKVLPMTGKSGQELHTDWRKKEKAYTGCPAHSRTRKEVSSERMNE